MGDGESGKGCSRTATGVGLAPRRLRGREEGRDDSCS